MVSYVYQMPSGIPGAVTRPEQSTIESQILDQTTPPLAFGVAVKNVSDKLKPIGAGDTRESIVGVLVRPYPTSGNGTDGLGVAVPNKALPGDLLKRGYISVLVNNFGSVPPVKDGKVYVRVSNPSTGKVVGNFEAGTDSTVTSPAIVGTGTGTIAATVGDATKIKAGAYVVTVLTTSNTSAVSVVDPDGIRLADGKIGVAYSDQGLNFTITAAGTMTAGDSFSPVVTANCILAPGNSYFTGGVDANGNGEIAFNI